MRGHVQVIGTGRSSVHALRWGVSALVLALVGASCGGDSGTGSTAPAEPTEAESPTSAAGGGEETETNGELFTIDITSTTWPLLPHGVPFMLEDQQGFFEAEGIEIASVVGSEGGGTTVRNVLTGNLAFGQTGGPAAVNAALSGAPLTIIGGGIQKVSEYCLASPIDSDIKSLEEAVNQNASVGYTNPGSGTHIALSLGLLRAGYEFEEVQATATNGLGAGITLANEGDLDVMSLIDPFGRLESAENLECFHSYEDDVPYYQQTMIITSPSFVEANPEIVAGFMQAWQNATAWIAENPEEAGAAWATVADIPEDVAVSTLQDIPLEEWFAVGLNPDAYNSLVEGMRAAGLLDEGESIPWDEIVNQDFLPDGVEKIDLSQLAGAEED